jgi:sulfur carrier protein
MAPDDSSASATPNERAASLDVEINGEPATIPSGLSFAELLVHLELTEGPVAIERNGEIVPRREHASARPEAGDRLEIVHFVGGG